VYTPILITSVTVNVDTYILIQLNIILVMPHQIDLIIITITLQGYWYMTVLSTSIALSYVLIYGL